MFSNIGSLFSIKSIDMLLGIWVIPFLIKKIGWEQYGVFAMSLALSMFFVNLLNYGFNLSAVRAVAKSKTDLKQINTIFNKVFSVKLFLLLVLTMFYFLLIYAFPQFGEHLKLYKYGFLLVVGDFFSLRWFFMGQERMKFMALIHLAGAIIYAFLVYLNIETPEDYYKIPLYIAVGMFFTSFVSFIWVIKSYKIAIRLLSLNKVLFYLKYNFSSFVNLLLPSTYGTVLVLIVGWLGTPVQVSLIHVGVKYTAAFSTLNNILTNVFYPIASRTQKKIKAIRKSLIISGVIMSLLMFLSANFLVEFWLKSEKGIELQQIIIQLEYLSVVPVLMAVISSYGVNGLHVNYRDTTYGKITLVASVIMVLFAFWLVPTTDFMGGAFAFIIGRIIAARLCYVYHLKYNLGG
ncbi:oligosaccharide flippase family protein [Flavicella marina]|uniref:oligosaccharide flippase family protein n=1 Tax=Flavicella marina TaxID=1475951 RepID=UPI001D014564|nr:oligosaccharide flippase family protein [Flavicella marina]